MYSENVLGRVVRESVLGAVKEPFGFFVFLAVFFSDFEVFVLADLDGRVEKGSVSGSVLIGTVIDLGDSL